MTLGRERGRGQGRRQSGGHRTKPAAHLRHRGQYRHRCHRPHARGRGLPEREFIQSRPDPDPSLHRLRRRPDGGEGRHLQPRLSRPLLCAGGQPRLHLRQVEREHPQCFAHPGRGAGHRRQGRCLRPALEPRLCPARGIQFEADLWSGLQVHQLDLHRGGQPGEHRSAHPADLKLRALYHAPLQPHLYRAETKPGSDVRLQHRPRAQPRAGQPLHQRRWHQRPLLLSHAGQPHDTR